MALTAGRHRDPCIVISSSGMVVNGGRVLHHLERMLPDARNTIVRLATRPSAPVAELSWKVPRN